MRCAARQRPYATSTGPDSAGSVEQLRRARRQLDADRHDRRVGLAEAERGERRRGVGRGLDLREEVVADLAAEQHVEHEVGLATADPRHEHALALEVGDLRGAARDELPAVVDVAVAHRAREDRVVAAGRREVRRVDERDRDLALLDRAREVARARVDLADAGAAERLAEVLAELATRARRAPRSTETARSARTGRPSACRRARRSHQHAEDRDRELHGVLSVDPLFRLDPLGERREPHAGFFARRHASSAFG